MRPMSIEQLGFINHNREKDWKKMETTGNEEVKTMNESLQVGKREERDNAQVEKSMEEISPLPKEQKPRGTR